MQSCLTRKKIQHEDVLQNHMTANRGHHVVNLDSGSTLLVISVEGLLSNVVGHVEPDWAEQSLLGKSD